MTNKESLNCKNIFNKTATFLSLISLTYLAFASSRSREKSHSIKRKQNYRCNDCGKKLKEEHLEIHHKIPKSKNGKDGKYNLIALGTSIEKGGCGCHDKRHNRNNSSKPTPS